MAHCSNPNKPFNAASCPNSANASRSNSQTDLSGTLTPKRGQERKINSTINKDLEAEKIRLQKRPVNKLLLVGPGDSGKTTVLKQMKLLHGDGFSERDRLENKGIIIQFLIHCVGALAGHALMSTLTSLESKPLLESLRNLSPNLPFLTPELCINIEEMWALESVQTVFRQANEFGFPDTGKYFIEHVSRIGDEKYLPTDQDILMTRRSTTRMTETDFLVGNHLYKMIDLGGQVSYRSQWAMFFDDAKAIIFVASLAGYDQCMEEDPSTNKMVDAMNLFKETINHKLLKSVPVILLLNKTDLAQEKLATSSLRKYFPELSCKYQHKNLLTIAKKNERHFDVLKMFFRYKFEVLSENKVRPIFTKFTNCTDITLMKHVIQSIMQVHFILFNV